MFIIETGKNIIFYINFISIYDKSHFVNINII